MVNIDNKQCPVSVHEALANALLSLGGMSDDLHELHSMEGSVEWAAACPQELPGVSITQPNI